MTQPALATTDKRTGARIYKHPVTKKRLPSVTTIIGKKDKPALVWWSAGLAAQLAVDEYARLFPGPGEAWASEEAKEATYQALRRAHTVYRDDRADLGDVVHNVAEAYANGLPMPEIREDAVEYVAAFVQFLEDQHVEILGSEITVWNPQVGYAGTFDNLWKIDGRIWLIDTKTGKGLYPDVVLQLAALGNAPFELREDGEEIEMPKIERYGALHVGPDRAVLHDLTEYIPKGFEAFKGCKMLYEWSTVERKVKQQIDANTELAAELDE